MQIKHNSNHTGGTDGEGVSLCPQKVFLTGAEERSGDRSLPTDSINRVLSYDAGIPFGAIPDEHNHLVSYCCSC
jgi:hypothetical protein